MKGERRSEAIWIEKKGYWQIKVQKDGVRKGFTSSTPGRKGKHQAETKADKWLETGTESMRFDAAWREFLNWQKEHNAEPTYIKHEQIGRLYIEPVVGRKCVADITPIIWQRCIDNGVKMGLSKRSCTNIRQTITTFLSYARRNRWDITPVLPGDLTISGKAPEEKEKRVLQPDDIRLLFAEETFQRSNRTVTAWYIHAWRLLVATGLRRGELCGLKVDDIAGSVINIKRSINSLGQVTTGKNSNARRTIAKTEIVRGILTDQAAMLATHGIKSPWVFPDEYGEMPSPNGVYKQWTAYARQHGMQLSLHEMRHTFISLAKADMPLELLKATVGHSDSMDTFGVYGHEIDGERERAAGIVDDIFGKILHGKNN